MKDRILVLTTSYPKYKGDTNGIFVHELNKRINKSFQLIVLAPWEKGLNEEEVMDDIIVIRHKQFIWNINFAYGSDIMEKLKKNPFLFLVIPFFLFYQILALNKIVKKYQITKIHAHWIITSGLVASLYKLLFNKKIKLMVTLLGADIWSFNKGWKKLLLKFSLKKINFITCQSKPLMTEILKLGFHHENIEVLPIGIDTEMFSPEKYDSNLKVQFNVKDTLLLFVGGLIERKGIMDLLNAMPEVIEHFPEIKLMIIGDGLLKEKIEQRIELLKLKENVLLLGKIENRKLPKYFATADIFILPSYSEGFPLVVMEALSSGTIPIVSKLPVFTEDPYKEKLYKFVECGDIKSIENTLIEVIKNLKNNIYSKRLPRDFAQQNLNLEIISNKYISRLEYLNKH
jgi:glycosyltransferase involved in cell wall biosynthesis